MDRDSLRISPVSIEKPLTKEDKPKKIKRAGTKVDEPASDLPWDT
jgi:hypothetical protein